MKTKNNEFLYLSDKLDILDQRLDNLERISDLQEQNLKVHMERTKILEDQVHPLNKFMYAAYGVAGFLTIAAAIYAALKG